MNTQDEHMFKQLNITLQLYYIKALGNIIVNEMMCTVAIVPHHICKTMQSIMALFFFLCTDILLINLFHEQMKYVTPLLYVWCLAVVLLLLITMIWLYTVPSRTLGPAVLSMLRNYAIQWNEIENSRLEMLLLMTVSFPGVGFHFSALNSPTGHISHSKWLYWLHEMNVLF